jgi:hypothetical protein
VAADPIDRGIDVDFEQKAIQFIRTEIAKSAPTNRRRIIEKFVLVALGSIPWVGGFISAAVNYKTEESAIRTDNLQTQWLEEHARKIAELMRDLQDIVERFEALGPDIDARIQSEQYLVLVRRAFRVWDRADTDQKKFTSGILFQTRRALASAPMTSSGSSSTGSIFTTRLTLP